MNCRFAMVGLLLTVSIVSCDKVAQNEPRGTWIGETAGVVRPGRVPGRFRETWTFKDGKITTNSGVEYTYKVDTTKEPKWIDVTIRGTEHLGIYKIENDMLTYCFLEPARAKADAKRPEQFDPTGRDDAMVVTFRRKKD